ncbi:divergent polysaccharide deacetylase family protein [Aquamicrobium sp. LC103]|nr:divergent polysaccharide deacetylase family protein [Aquamicrobium sp. LC103]
MERPLGLEPRGKRPRGGSRPRLTAGGAVLSLVSIAILGTSGAIAFREKPFRNPPPLVVSTPEPADAAATAPVPPASTGYVAGGPSIIKVNPPDAAGQSVVVIRDPSALGQNPLVAHLPDRDLIEETDIGPLPRRGADGRRPFDVYARPWSGARGARVAIVIGGLGVSQTGTQNAIAKLPPEVTLAFASGGNSLDRWMQTARRQGHEIVMQVPLEPFDYPNVDPGRNTLTVEAAEAENRDRLHWALSRITNYTGIMNYMGARFVTDGNAMPPFFGELGKRGLMYFDDGSSARSLAPEMAARNRVPFAAADMTLDGVRERGEILRRLDDLERTARAKGFAIGTGSAFDATVDAVAGWIAEARRRGIEIVPISAVANDPERG